MDQRLLSTLDALEQGARGERLPPPRVGRNACNNSTTQFSACDECEPSHACTRMAPSQHDDYAEQPMVLDSFDERLLQHPDYDTGQAQVAMGRTRMSLQPSKTSHLDSRIIRPEPQRDLNLSRSAFDSGRRGFSSSPPPPRPQPSSPTLAESQRRPAVYDYDRDRHRFSYRPSQTKHEQHDKYETFSPEQLEAEEYNMQTSLAQPAEDFQQCYIQEPVAAASMPKRRDVPVVQGIALVSTHDMPDSFRSIFPFPLFNAVQSKSFDTIYKTNDNFVLSSPTGSGKTAVLEIAICRLINGFVNGSFKIVYMAPIKALCAERQRDWHAKFGPLGLQCSELTGDTESVQLRHVQHANIIITTPEKWDSISRKWKDHQKLMNMVKLFLIDEVHLLKEDRGATLEAVVSRMKNIGSNVRFIALSATVFNSEDIAAWLGKDPINTHLPAAREKFGEEFRPVQLQKHVCGYQGTQNDFSFEKMLNGKLPEVIQKYSQRKPLMVFCFTRNSCVDTAKLMANWWATKGPAQRYWNAPRQRLIVCDKDLQDTVSSGVAYHHAGLSNQDRAAVEKGYLAGDIGVICCTSTLAVGVNLPCHMVVIKNTITYAGVNGGQGACKEYSDLEVMQMLGRAGRPQFDDSAVAVIMTRSHRVSYYEKMMSGQEVLESRLHLNLIDHLNSEIGLGTINSASSAKKWLSSTFLYVRLKENPEHYKIDGSVPGRTLDERLENICRDGIAALEAIDLVESEPKLHCTEFGDSMSRYFVQFNTMKIFMSLQRKSKVSEILSVISQANEFRDVRFRAREKSTYKDLNKSSSIKFPIPVNLDASAHKVSLIIQSVLGSIELPTDDFKQKTEYNTAKNLIFQHMTRFIRCIIDCQLELDDAVTARNALMLGRSVAAHAWDDSPLHMKQLDGVGIVAVRKLAAVGIKSIEDIENTEQHRLGVILSRNPPFGGVLQEKARAFPKLRVSLKMFGEPVIKKGEYVTIRLVADIGFLNDKSPETFKGRVFYVCILAETSDGHKVHFARISAKKLGKGQDVLFSANLTSPTQTVRIYVMGDELAGTVRHAIFKPEIPGIAFPPPKTAEEMNQRRGQFAQAPNTSRKRATPSKSADEFDEFGDAGLDDADLALAESGGSFANIDDFDDNDAQTALKPKRKQQKTTHGNAAAGGTKESRQRSDGRWECNHACKDKTACKHLCCREGLEKMPKPKPAKKDKSADSHSEPGQMQLNITSVKKKSAQPMETVRSIEKAQPPARARKNEDKSQEIRNLNRLHDGAKTSTGKVPILGTTASTANYKRGAQHKLSFLEAARSALDDDNSDYGGLDSNDLPDRDALSSTQRQHVSPPQGKFNTMVTLQQDAAESDEMMLDEPIYLNDHDEDGPPGAGDYHVDLSSYADLYDAERQDQWCLDETADFEDVVRKNRVLSEDLPPPPLKSRTKPLFMGEDTNFMPFSPDETRNATNSRNTKTQPESGVVGFGHTILPYPYQAADEGAEDTHLHQPVVHEGFLPSEGRDTHAKKQCDLHAQASTKTATGAVEDSEPPRPQSCDDDVTLEQWFKQEFGTEQFSYLG